MTGGVAQTATQGKMYVSAVLLPDGKVFETGGGLHNRADPVYEASMFDPVTNTFTAGMATDPVPRTYHSSAFLLPDGRVMAVGDNPGDGSFDMRLSVYSPPYLFKGARPQITEPGEQPVGVRRDQPDHGGRADPQGVADPAGGGHALQRPEPALTSTCR